jgi:chromosome segregation ATPase
MIEQQKTCAASMTEATQSYKELVANASGFAEVAGALKGILSGLEVQKTQLRASLESLAALIVSASKGLPKIEAKILEMTNQMEAGVRANNEQWAGALKAVTETVRGSHAELKKLLVNTVQSANDELNSHVREMADQTRQQVVALDRALEKGLNDSLESLGRQLTALSQKFVEDYAPLTDRLRQVVQIGRAVA